MGLRESIGGAEIRLRPEGETAPEVTIKVAPTSGGNLMGEVSMTGAQDPSVRVTACDAGLIARRGGSGSPSTPAPTTTSTSTTTTTVAPPPAGPTAGSGAPCDAETLGAVVRGNISSPVQYFSVSLCNERWALGGVTYEEQDDPWLLEWNGSAWVTGACQKYRDPNDWTKSPVVPEEYWIACIVD